MTVADIVSRAGIARNTFYENFRSKEDCFLATQEYAMTAALERVVAAAGAGQLADRVRAGLTAFLEYVAEEPALARTCMVEALSAGPAAVERYEKSQQAFVSLFKLGRDVSPHGGSCRRHWRKRSSAASSGSSTSASRSARWRRSPSCCRELVEFALTPYLGAEAAREVATGDDADRSMQAGP